MGKPTPKQGSETQPKPARYRLYIDESGDHAYKLLDDPAHRYLALLGVWFEQRSDYIDYENALSAFKQSIFGHAEVHLHRSDIINRKGPFGRLCDSDTKQRFDDGLIEVLQQARFRMVCVVLDKQRHQEKYSSPLHPYHYCMTALAERYCGWLDLKNAVGDIMAESRGRAEDNQLMQAYERLYEAGTYYLKPEKFQRVLTTRKLKVKPKSADISGLEMADILAHPVKQFVLTEAKLVRSGNGGLYAGRLLDAVKPKFNRNIYTGTVNGYGSVVL